MNSTTSSKDNNLLVLYFLSGISGLLPTISFPSFDYWFAAWFALCPLMVMVSGLDMKKAFKAGFFFGAIHFGTLLYWMVYTMKVYGFMPYYFCIPVFLLLIFYLSLYPAVFALLFSRLARYVEKGAYHPAFLLITAPCLWTALEFLRARLFTGFPWELFGASQYGMIHIIQIADVFGVYGVSFIVVLVNTMLYIAFVACGTGSKFHLRLTGAQWFITVILTLFFPAAALYYGEMRITHADAIADKWEYKTISVVQGNIDQSQKWDKAFQDEVIQKYVNLSLEASRTKPDLIVWPETSTPFYLGIHRQKTKLLLDKLKPADTYFLIGSPSARMPEHADLKKENPGPDYYNTAYMVNPEGEITGYYDKTHLVPFGEYVPLKRLLPFVDKMVQDIGDFSKGVKGKVLSWNGHDIGVLICFEQVFPYLSRAVTRNGAELIINITNDAWFGTSNAPYQHFSMAVLRAVESGKSVVRAANTGISGFIDPLGRVIDESDLFVDAHLTAKVPLNGKITFYARYGDWFAIICLLTGIFAGIIIFRKEK